MSFISYAQNFEDVMLWRVLKHVEKGFYIDVGANDPDIDSVTKAFYERGWRGINIEPVSQWFQRLQEARVRDINLQMAVGNQTGEITLYEIPDTGLSTGDKSFAERHQAERGYQCQETSVPQDTLTNVSEKYHIAPIHFLKIDVEGMEKAVLEGTDFNRVRPWIVLVESTLPNSTEESHGDWESILQDAGYQYVYGDGLNRYYLATEHSELVSAFQYPPNFFDDFVLNKHLKTEIRARNAEARLREIESEHQATKKLLAQSEARTEEDETVIRKVQSENDQLRVQLNRATAKVGQLERKLGERDQELASISLELQWEHERNEWLQNEWDAAKAEIDELKHSSHQWWIVADGFNQELHAIYGSKFWRLTLPLRKVMEGLKSMLQFLAGLINVPKRAARWFLTKTIGFILRRNRLKRLARQYLYRHPQLEAHLRAFANRRGLMQQPRSFAQNTDQMVDMGDNVVGWEDGSNGSADPSIILAPRARQIYQDLNAAVERQKECQ